MAIGFPLPWPKVTNVFRGKTNIGRLFSTLQSLPKSFATFFINVAEGQLKMTIHIKLILINMRTGNANNQAMRTDKSMEK